MIDRFGRDTSHLRDSEGEYPPEFAIDCIAAVEELFGKNWLEGAEGQLGHRLQKLWERKDWLSTCELFGLGKCILLLTPKHKTWLNQTAKKIKSAVENAHGFITEILTCGSIKASKGEVYPAPGNQKGYDFVVDFPSDFKYYISIKSQGVASHELTFHELGDRLKEAFSQRLDFLGIDGELYLESAEHIGVDVFEYLIKFVGSVLKTPQAYTYRGCRLTFRKMQKTDKSYASCYRSHQVTITCPHHRNALKNATSKLLDAAKNMGLHLPCSDEYFRYLWIRVHSSTEVSVLQEAAQKMLDDDLRDYGFDGVFFIQPSVIRTGSKSEINTYLSIAAAGLHQGFNRAIVEGRVTLITMEFPVGGLSTKPSELHVTNGKLGVTLPSNYYFYQKADLYFLMEREGDEMVGEWLSPASGIRHHIVYADGKKEILFPSPTVEVEETLII